MSNAQQLFVEFGKDINGYAQGISNGNSVTEQGTEPDYFVKNLYNAYSKTHLYNVDESTKKLLLLTKPPKGTTIEHIPHKEMFIGVEFTKEEIKHFTDIDIEYDKLKGVIIQEGETILQNADGNTIELPTGRTIRIITLCDDGEGTIFNTFNLRIDVFEEYKDMKHEIKEFKGAEQLKRFAQMFSINLINLILDPEVELIFREANAAQNMKRIKKQKIPFPNNTTIRLTGKRKVYVDSLLNGDSFSYGHSFWVQGFYRTLSHERYGKNIGKKIWVAPFVKGKGILIEKNYEVEI